MPDRLPSIHFGEVPEGDVSELENPQNELEVWDSDEDNDEDIPADEELIELLGFDPDDESEEDEETRSDDNEDDLIPQAEAGYEDPAKGDDHCAKCLFFEGPDECGVVEPKVSADGWCRFFFSHDNLEDDLDIFADSFNEEDHPRAPAGVEGGGQFVGKAGGGGAPTSSKLKPVAGAKAANRMVKVLKSFGYARVKGTNTFEHVENGYQIEIKPATEGQTKMTGWSRNATTGKAAGSLLKYLQKLHSGKPSSAPIGKAPVAAKPTPPEATKLVEPPQAANYPKGIGPTLLQSSLKKVGEKKGSNPGGVYEDKEGHRYYLKEPATNDHSKNELTAAALFRAAGGNTLNYHQVVDGDKLNLATSLLNLEKNNVSQFSPAEKNEAQKDFALHAWLGNWDAVGLDGSNIVTVPGGFPIPVDFGGALKYRAQGAPKSLLPDSPEWESLRDPTKNKQAAEFYGDMTTEQLFHSAKRLAKVSDETIRQIVNQIGPGDSFARDALATTLIERRNAIQKKASAAAAAPPPPEVVHQAGVGSYVPESYNNIYVVSPTEPHKVPSDVYAELTNEAPKKTQSELDALGNYSAAGYHEMNDCMRFLTDCSHLPDVGHINGFLKRAKTTKPLTLFRGVKNQYAASIVHQIQKAKEKGAKSITVEDRGFMSTTVKTEIAHNFGGSGSLGFIIEVPEGSHAASINNAYEGEVLLQQGTRLIVTGEKDKLTGYYKARVDQSHLK